jgi:sigma-B regulation protein RsbU (phosphoserine phosphatase)
MELAKTILYVLTGGFAIFLAITVTRDNFASRLNRVTGAMLFCAGLGPIFIVLNTIVAKAALPEARLEESTLYNLQYLWELFFPLFLLFSWIFPVNRLKEFKHLGVRYLIFVPAVLHLALALFYDELIAAEDFLKNEAATESFSSVLLQPLSKILSLLVVLVSVIRTYQTSIFGVLYLIYVIIAVYFLESGRKLITNPRLMTQTRIVLWGTRIGLLLFLTAALGPLLVPTALPTELRPTLLTVALLVWAAFLIFATIRHQFLDVRYIFRRSFVYTISSAILVGAYILIILQSKRFLTPFFGEQAVVVSYAFIILLLLMFQPINNWIDDLIRSMFMRTRTDHRNILERFSRQVISLFDPERLRGIIEETLKTSLLVDKVYFILYDDTIEEYAVLPSEDFPRRIVLDRNDFMLRGINLLESPTYLHSLADYREGSPLANLLEERRVKLILPLKDAKHLLGFVALTDKVAGYRYSSEDINLLGVLANQMVTALTNARLYVESLERMRLQEEVTMARQIQLDLLPAEPPQLGCFSVWAHSTPSRTVGGDFYDFITIDDHRLGIVIADASGKGMPAALMIAQIQAIIRSEVNNGNPISTMLKNVNQQILHSSSAEKYATLFYGELDTAQARFSYSNAGHNYPILVRANGDVELLKEGGIVIGALPQSEYEFCTVTLHPHDILFLFTDGLSEALNNEGEEYGESRIREIIRKYRSEDPRTIVDRVLEDMKSHDPTFPPRDDTTVIAIKMNERVT